MLRLSCCFAWRASLAAILGASCAAGSAAARPEDTFPQAPTRPDILRWLAGNSDLNTDAIVTMTDDVVVAITDRQDGRGVGRSTRLTLREEVINPDAAAAWGGRSIQLDLDLDCARHRVILGARRVYARPNLQGSARITRSDNAWAQVPADTVIDDVAHVACAPPKPPAQLADAQPAAAAPAVQATAEPAPAAPAPAPAPEVAKAPAPASVQVAAADPPPAPEAPTAVDRKAPPEPSAPAEAPPAAAPPSPGPEAAPSPAPARLAAADAAPAVGRVVSFDPPPAPAPAAETTAGTTVTLAAPSGAAVAVAPAQSVSPPEVQPRPADQSVVVHNPFVVAQADAPKVQPPAQDPPPQPAKPAARPATAVIPPARPPEFAVQIAAVASADLARDSWQSLKAKLPSLVGPRTFAVEPVEAKGRTLYRALLLGFDSPDEAVGLCKELRSQSVDCILRQMK